MARVEVSRQYIRDAASQPAVVDHLRVVAERVAARTEQIAGSEGRPVETSVEVGQRPGWRPQALVYSTNPEQEWGSRATHRVRMLGRAAEGER